MITAWWTGLWVLSGYNTSSHIWKNLSLCSYNMTCSYQLIYLYTNIQFWVISFMWYYCCFHMELNVRWLARHLFLQFNFHWHFVLEYANKAIFNDLKISQGGGGITCFYRNNLFQANDWSIIIISLNEVFGDIMVLTSPPPRPPVDPDNVSALTRTNFNGSLSNFI